MNDINDKRPFRLHEQNWLDGHMKYFWDMCEER